MRSRKRRRQQLHEAREHRQLDAALLQPARELPVARLAVVAAREHRHLDAGAAGAVERRARRGREETTATTRTGVPAPKRSSSACRFVPWPGHQHGDAQRLGRRRRPDHVYVTPLPGRTVPIRHASRPAARGGRDGAGDVDLRHDGDHADAAVEHAPHLVPLHAEAGEPREHLGPLPGARVDLRAEPLGQHARQVALDAAARDVGQRADVHGVEQGRHLGRVDRRRREQPGGRVGRVDPVVLEQAPHEREAVGVGAVGGEADQHVAVRHAAPVDEPRALHGADREAGQVDVALAVERGDLRRLAAEQRAAGPPAAVRDALDELGDAVRDRAGRSRRSRGRRAAARRCRARR